MPPVKPTRPSITTILRCVRRFSHGRFQIRAEAHRVEPGDFAAGRQQRREEALRAMRRADRIEQQAHRARRRAHARPARRASPCRSRRAKDVVLEVDLVARAARSSASSAVVGRRRRRPAAAHVGGGGERQAGGLARQPRPVRAPRPARRAPSAGGSATLRLRAPQALALDALRPEHVIDQEADVGQRRQRQQPAQRRRRLALLQHDPAAQPHQVGDPPQGQEQLEMAEVRAATTSAACRVVEHEGFSGVSRASATAPA